MKRFYCECGHEVFFNNTHCNQCDALLGFDSRDQSLHSLTAVSGGYEMHGKSGYIVQRCQLHDAPVACNWLVVDDHASGQCLSCRTTHIIPDQSYIHNARRWNIFESAKKRMIYGLLKLNLPLNPRHGYPLVFHFLEDQASNPDIDLEQVLSGHLNGIITINAAEADSSYREATREAMNESYRTLLGHFRHEIGHYYWQLLIENQPAHDSFMALFGDQNIDYRTALDQHYLNGPPEDWQSSYISAYASSHPLEDWAETWAHYLLMNETLETAIHFSMLSVSESPANFDQLILEWMQLVFVLNALNRSIGNADAYPFVISDTVKQKLAYIHNLISSRHQNVD